MTEHEAMAEFIHGTSHQSETGKASSRQRQMNRQSINLVFKDIRCPNSSSTESSVSPCSSETDKSSQMAVSCLNVNSASDISSLV